MSLRTRVRALERRLGPSTPGPNAIPHLVTVYVDSNAPTCNPEPIRWGNIPGIPTVFERGPDESENDFIARLARNAPKIRTPFAALSKITIHAETLKPEPPAMSS